jgi:hypothetical protein
MVASRPLTIAALLLATFAAQAGASERNLAPAGPSERHAVPPPKSTSFTAVVAADGTLVRGDGATGASQPEGTGSYEVDFVNDVSQCVFVATVGATGNEGTEPASFITVVRRNGVPNGVYVTTGDGAGNAADFPFHLDVGC